MRVFLLLVYVILLSGCTGANYTTDDGRKVNEELLGNIRAFGQGERVLRPAIVRSATLKDPDCSTQWELPFSVASSYDAAEDDRVAWVRELGVDERLTVVGASPDSPLQVKDKIESIGPFKLNSEQMLLLLAKMRDDGFPFDVTLTSKKKVKVAPFQVCRGYTRLAPPNTPAVQDYHWLLSIHPLEVARADLSEDEALWVVLWAQGVSEEGGARMKLYHYSKETVGTMFTLFTVASGIQAASVATQAAANVARSTLSSYVTDVARDQAVDIYRKLTKQEIQDAMLRAEANRKSLSGVAWVASTVFEKADTWAYNRMEKLNGNPLAGFSLHQKLIERNSTTNSMVFDPARFQSLNKLAGERGRAEDVAVILQGIKPEDIKFDQAEMPLASAPEGFSYEDKNDLATRDQPFAYGLVDGMLNMPVSTATKE